MVRKYQHSFNGATSFQTWKHMAVLALPLLIAASMGPRLFRRGNKSRRGSLRRKRLVLQWGHVFSDVETVLELTDERATTFNGDRERTEYMPGMSTMSVIITV